MPPCRFTLPDISYTFWVSGGHHLQFYPAEFSLPTGWEFPACLFYLPQFLGTFRWRIDADHSTWRPQACHGRLGGRVLEWIPGWLHTAYGFSQVGRNCTWTGSPLEAYRIPGCVTMEAGVLVCGLACLPFCIHHHCHSLPRIPATILGTF